MSKGKKFFSIRKKMYIFVVTAVLAVALGTSAIAFKTGADQIDKYYKQSAADNAYNFSTTIDGDFMGTLRKVAESDEYQAIREKAEAADDNDMIQNYLTEKGLWEKYSEIRESLTKYLANMEAIKYLYLVAHGDKDAEYDMYLIDDDSTDLYETGYYEEREAELRGLDISELKEPTISSGQWGWLCSAFKPVYDSAGNCVCVVGCDFGMDEVMQERSQLLIYLIIGALIFTAAVLTGSVLFINKVVIKPLDDMTTDMKKFTPMEHLSLEDAGVMSLDIKSHDEINEIYHGIRTMQINIVNYLKDLSMLQEDKLKAENEVIDKDIQIDKLTIETYKDTLTGVGSKAAYIKAVDDLNKKLSAGNVEFAIVMIDLNNLKQVNDAYGHKAGDQYIIGCTQMICEAFSHSPVFRIGGDEFVVILQGHDYENRSSICDELRTSFAKSYTQTHLEQWHRYSAAIGMAENAHDDRTVDLVFKRADKRMYDDKARFKDIHGSYR